jgi:hypothetical protein
VAARCEQAFFYTSDFSNLCFLLSAMDGKIEQCFCVKFCLKLSKSATETLEMLRESFGEHSLNRTAVFEWHSNFKAGRVSAENGKRSGATKNQQNDRKC